ncbi:uncharacterized protein [Halyomorpha halys]|uniref:uncharacterized protein n=1 Tax=Halyomorpha halys TaxID=286706 RepID=UPI0006D51534|nr:uncharacterized protein LOC106683344 [Halyomorpha halys]
MTPQWFLKGVITSLLIHFMAFYGEANNAVNRENDKYLEGLSLSHTAKDEKAFQMVKERIKDVLRQEESKPFYTVNDEGPRKFFYKKYMKLGKARDDPIDYDNKESRHPSQYNLNQFSGNIVKDLEKKSRHFQDLSARPMKERNELERKEIALDKLNEYPKGDNWKIRLEPTILPNRISNNNKYSKENLLLNNVLVKNSPHLKNEENFPKNIIHPSNELNTSLRTNDDNYQLLNSYLDQMKNQKDTYLEKQMQNEEIKVADYKNKEGINKIINDYKKETSSVNSVLRTSISLKGLNYKKKRKCYRPDKKTIENEKTHESNEMQPKDHRRVRSCDVKMEDLRESFIPNEQLSIYHPKMSLSDQFILQDTMF